MWFRKDKRQKAIMELALKQIEKVLWEMHDEGKELTGLKIKKYQKTHFSNCNCVKCRQAERNRNPHQRGLLEEGYKVYVGVGDGAEN